MIIQNQISELKSRIQSHYDSIDELEDKIEELKLQQKTGSIVEDLEPLVRLYYIYSETVLADSYKVEILEILNFMSYSSIENFKKSNGILIENMLNEIVNV